MPIQERTGVLLMRHVPTASADHVDTEGDFSVGDHVQFEFHGGVIDGYIAEFERDSYLFYKDGVCRPFARVVMDWNARHKRPYGHCVLLSNLQHVAVG